LNVLLDTNTLIWLLGDHDGGLLGPKAKELIQDTDTVYALSVSVLEIRIKAMPDKLEAPECLLPTINTAELKELPCNMEHVDALTKFPKLSRHDTFECMLLAQAKVEGIYLLTSYRLLLDQNINYLLNART
jgi:PIN domain nuclease of toxin-antitoxin system